MVEAIKLLIVDDDPLVRCSLRTILSEENGIEIAGEAASGDEALEMLGSCNPDVILMDIRMPGSDGIETIRTISRRRPDIQILALTVYEEKEWVHKALEAGAIGYLVKSTSRRVLAEAIRKARNGEPVLRIGESPERLLVNYVRRQYSIPDSSNTRRLTERENEVLTLVARGLTNEAIAKKLFISTRTVKAHMSRILRKLGVKGRTQAAIYALQKGILNGGD